MPADGRGRRPKPTSLLRLQATYRPCRHDERQGEVEASGDLAEMAPPDWFTDEQKELWADIIVEAPLDVLKRIDWQVFTNYVELVDRHRRAVLAQRKIDQGMPVPFMVKGSNGPAISPLIRVINHCVLAMRLLQNEMGFTPAARTRIRLAGPRTIDADDPDSGWGLLDRLRALPDKTSDE